jgi:methyl-accepting chemotaxis protein
MMRVAGEPAADTGAKMTSNADRIKNSMTQVEEQIKTVEKLLKQGVDDAGSTTARQKRQIAQSANQVGKLLTQIEALRPGFIEAFKGKLSCVVK